MCNSDGTDDDDEEEEGFPRGVGEEGKERDDEEDL